VRTKSEIVQISSFDLVFFFLLCAFMRCLDINSVATQVDTLANSYSPTSSSKPLSTAD